jgi:hypothetical protein
MSQEDVFVQACTGFAIPRNCAAGCTFHPTSDPTGEGINERRKISFAANSATPQRVIRTHTMGSSHALLAPIWAEQRSPSS